MASHLINPSSIDIVGKSKFVIILAESRFTAEEIVWEDTEKKKKVYTKITLILISKKETVTVVSVCNWLSVVYSGVLLIFAMLNLSAERWSPIPLVLQVRLELRSTGTLRYTKHYLLARSCAAYSVTNPTCTMQAGDLVLKANNGVGNLKMAQPKRYRNSELFLLVQCVETIDIPDL
jgi:hypothetical protein